MKYIVLAVTCLAAYGAAGPSCPPASANQTVAYFPHPSDCSKFLSCHWGNLVELSCPTGMFWNDSIKACDLQANVNCVVAPETTTTTEQPSTSTTELQSTTSTTEVPTTPSNPAQKCPEQYDPDHQVYLPHEDCTKFYICTWGGVAVEQKCPANLHWNQHLSYCDYPAQDGCVSTSSPTGTPTSAAPTSAPPTAPPTTPSSTPAPTTTTTAPTTSAPQPTNDCPAVYDPNHQVYFPHADCTKYYICTYEGNKLEQNCPAGLHWSQQSSYCDRPELAHCTPAK